MDFAASACQVALKSNLERGWLINVRHEKSSLPFVENEEPEEESRLSHQLADLIDRNARRPCRMEGAMETDRKQMSAAIAVIRWSARIPELSRKAVVSWCFGTV
jgi:hypothetical protein